MYILTLQIFSYKCNEPGIISLRLMWVPLYQRNKKKVSEESSKLQIDFFYITASSINFRM